MTRIHMETEQVSQLSHQLALSAAGMEDFPREIHSLAMDLGSAWQGGNAEDYKRQIRRLSEDLKREIENLARLAAQVGREVDQWETADTNGAHSFQSVTTFPHYGLNTEAQTQLSPLRYPDLPVPQEPNNSLDWEASLDVVGVDQWTRREGWNTEAEVNLGVKVDLLEGAYREGEGSASWSLGGMDVGGVIGDYGVSQGEAGVKFGMDEDGFNAGAYGEYDLVDASAGAVLGSSLLGLTLSASGAVGSADGFIGVKSDFKDTKGREAVRVGASIGASAVSGELGLGMNIGGANVGVSAGLSLGLEFGIELGSETRLKAGPFKVGLKLGKAISD